MKKILLLLAMLLVTTIAMSQIKVLSNGNVNVGGNSVCSHRAKLQVDAGGNNIVIGPDDGGTNIGAYWGNSGTPRLDFWHPIAKWNNVKMKVWGLSSDSTLKTQIIPLGNTTNILKQINTYSYFFKSDSVLIRSDSVDLRKREYGVLAQEIKPILPDLVDTCNGEMFVNYNAFIALLIKGFNEQQTVIEQQQNQIGILQNIVTAQQLDIIQLTTLQKEVIRLQEAMKECCKNPKGGMYIPDNPDEPQGVAILYQNAPNPFSANTEISCYLPETVSQAAIYIYNLQGVELKSYPLTQAGVNTIMVNGLELPAGMYLYTLVVDNEIIDTKRMILTK